MLPDEPLFLGQLGLVRWLYGTAFPSQALKARPGRCYNPRPRYRNPKLALPNLVLEGELVAEQFQATPLSADQATVSAFLRAGDSDLLHFAGHGEADIDKISRASLLLDDDVVDGRYVNRYLKEGDVSQHLRMRRRVQGAVAGEGSGPAAGSGPLVVVNACQAGRVGRQLAGLGGFANAFLSKGASMFVGTLWSVGDEAALQFAKALYGSLLAGRTLAEAAVSARAAALTKDEAARTKDDVSWLAYTFYGRPSARLTTSE